MQIKLSLEKWKTHINDKSTQEITSEKYPVFLHNYLELKSASYWMAGKRNEIPVLKELTIQLRVWGELINTHKVFEGLRRNN